MGGSWKGIEAGVDGGHCADSKSGFIIQLPLREQAHASVNGPAERA